MPKTILADLRVMITLPSVKRTKSVLATGSVADVRSAIVKCLDRAGIVGVTKRNVEDSIVAGLEFVVIRPDSRETLREIRDEPKIKTSYRPHDGYDCGVRAMLSLDAYAADFRDFGAASLADGLTAANLIERRKSFKSGRRSLRTDIYSLTNTAPSGQFTDVRSGVVGLALCPLRVIDGTKNAYAVFVKPLPAAAKAATAAVKAAAAKREAAKKAAAEKKAAAKKAREDAAKQAAK